MDAGGNLALGQLRSSPGRAGTGARTTSRRRFILAMVVIAAAIGFLLYKGLGSALDYYLPVNQALAQRGALGQQSFRIEGVVVPGTLAAHGAVLSFDISHGGKTVLVHSTGSPPQMFQPNIRVVLDGHFAPTGALAFDSNRIMVKHSSVYAPRPAHGASPSQLKAALTGKVAPAATSATAGRA